MAAHPDVFTLGQLRSSGWTSRPVKEEIRANAIARIRAGTTLFPRVLGYEETVLPQLENALLAGHDVIFLGERGQAKTRMIRSLTELLDEWMPIVAGSEINDDPLRPGVASRSRPAGRRGRRDAHHLGAPRRSLRREAGHPRHLDRRPDRRGRPHQGGRGSLPVRRADAALRPGAAHQPGHLRHQRAARPGRAHPGGPAQRAGGARRAGAGLQDPPAPRRDAVRLGQPRGLHQPRSDHHARSRIASAPRSAPTTRSTSTSRWTSPPRRPPRWWPRA